MSASSDDKWESLPDDRQLVDVSRLPVPDGWLVLATGVGGTPRFGGLVHFPDPAHEWRPLEEKGVDGPRALLRWEELRSQVPDGITTRLRVPGGWLVHVDFERENTVAQLAFCPDPGHQWRG